MSAREEIQTLIPEAHRDLVEAVPKGFTRSGFVGGILFGGVLGALATYLMPAWLAGTFVLVLFIAQRIYVHFSDRLFDRRMAGLNTRGLDWNPESEAANAKADDSATSSDEADRA